MRDLNTRKYFFNGKYCIKCKRVWERKTYTEKRELKGSLSGISLYEDFPTYGLKRKECPVCE